MQTRLGCVLRTQLSSFISFPFFILKGFFFFYRARYYCENIYSEMLLFRRFESWRFIIPTPKGHYVEFEKNK